MNESFDTFAILPNVAIHTALLTIRRQFASTINFNKQKVPYRILIKS